MTDIVGILLAAGDSRRFGSDKRWHPLAGGEPMGIAAARTLVGVLPCSIAVVRCGDDALAAAFAELGFTVVVNREAARGMGNSLAAAVRESGHCGGWLVALADMPWIRAATIQLIAGRLRDGASIVAPTHGGRRGHPVGFAARWHHELVSLDGDQGARRILAAHPSALLLQPVDDPGVLYDVDRPPDLADVPGGPGHRGRPSAAGR